mgnify:FL=1
MKASELMLGDWVEFETPTTEFRYGKVIGISEHYVTIGTLNDNVCVEIDKVGQIPITSNILKKNEFEKYFAGYYKNPKELHISCDENQEHWYISDSHEQYIHGDSVASFSAVHELQNILRILGFNDLADNFKI